MFVPQRSPQGTERNVINYISAGVQLLLLFKNVLIIDTFNYTDYREDGFGPEI
jgi:hypothetical protein